MQDPYKLPSIDQFDTTKHDYNIGVLDARGVILTAIANSETLNLEELLLRTAALLKVKQPETVIP